MKNSLVKRQVMKAQSKKHRKAKQVQFQELQHKEGKLNIIKILQNILPSLIITFSSIMNRTNNITMRFLFSCPRVLSCAQFSPAA
jgi:hypothetical protein